MVIVMAKQSGFGYSELVRYGPKRAPLDERLVDLGAAPVAANCALPGQDNVCSLALETAALWPYAAFSTRTLKHKSVISDGI